MSTGMPRRCFVDAVVDEFLGQVVGPASVGVHARAFSHRVEAGKDFDGIGVVRARTLLGHGVSCSSIESGKVDILPQMARNTGESEKHRQTLGKTLKAMIATGLDTQRAGAVIALGIAVIEGFVGGLQRSEEHTS